MDKISNSKVYVFISPAIFPFTLCIFLILFSFLYDILNLPSPDELIVVIENWFVRYGLYLVFIAAFIEGVFMIGLYFPGSLAIALSIYSLAKTPLDLILIGSIAFIAFLLANILNYILGKYGYYRLLLLMGSKKTIESMQRYMTKYGNRTFFITGILPNLFAITSVSAGISNLGFSKTIFFQTTALLLWITIWTIVGSFLISYINLSDNNQPLYIILIIFFWGVFLIFKEYIKKKKIRN